jgi:hypothetical protein
MIVCSSIGCHGIFGTSERRPSYMWSLMAVAPLADSV